MSENKNLPLNDDLILLLKDLSRDVDDFKLEFNEINKKICRHDDFAKQFINFSNELAGGINSLIKKQNGLMNYIFRNLNKNDIIEVENYSGMEKIIEIYANFSQKIGLIVPKGNDRFICNFETGEKFILRKNLVDLDILPPIDTFYDKRYSDYLNNMKVGDIFFDIGSYMGDMSIFFAENRGCVYIFEPDEELFSLTAENLSLNKIKYYINGNYNYNKYIIAGNNYQNNNELIIKSNDDLKSIISLLNSIDSIFFCRIDGGVYDLSGFSDIDNLVLRKIKHILIEFHFKEPEDVIKKLKESGFNVLITEENNYIKKYNTLMGFLSADLI